jgi:hypothetical protein
MAKLAKVLLLLVIIVGGAVAYFLMREQPREQGMGGEATVESADQGEPPRRIEEKYGFTSETVSP